MSCFNTAKRNQESQFLMARVKKVRWGCHGWMRKRIRRLALGTVSGNKSKSVFSLTSKSMWAGKGEGRNHLNVRPSLKFWLHLWKGVWESLQTVPGGARHCVPVLKRRPWTAGKWNEQWEQQHGKRGSRCESLGKLRAGRADYLGWSGTSERWIL